MNATLNTNPAATIVTITATTVVIIAANQAFGPLPVVPGGLRFLILRMLTKALAALHTDQVTLSSGDAVFCSA